MKEKMGRRIVRVKKIGEMLPYTKTVREFAREQTGSKLTKFPIKKRKIDWSKKRLLSEKERTALDLVYPLELNPKYIEMKKAGEKTPWRKYKKGNTLEEAARKMNITTIELQKLLESAFNKMEVK